LGATEGSVLVRVVSCHGGYVFAAHRCVGPSPTDARWIARVPAAAEGACTLSKCAPHFAVAMFETTARRGMPWVRSFNAHNFQAPQSQGQCHTQDSPHRSGCRGGSGQKTKPLRKDFQFGGKDLPTLSTTKRKQENNAKQPGNQLGRDDASSSLYSKETNDCRLSSRRGDCRDDN